MAMPASSVSTRPTEGPAVESGAALASERVVLATVALGTMLAPLNSTMIAVALPRIMADLGIGVGRAGVLVTAYLIAMAAVQPLGGKLGDRLGRRPLLLGGLALFAVASCGAALAPTYPLLLGFRVLQAVAGALALPNGVALVRQLVPPERRASRFGLIGATTGFAAAVGPPLGGLLVGLLGWRAIFSANLALIAPALLLGWRAIPVRERRPGGQPFDLGGAVLLTLLLGSGAGLLVASRRGLPSWSLALGGAALLGLAAAFLRRELHHPDPIVPPRLYRHRAFAAASGAVALSNLAMYVTLLAIPQLLAGHAGWSDVKVGLVLTTLSAAMVLCAPLGGRIADRRGRRWPVVGGLTLLTVGLLPLALTAGELAAPVLLGSLGLAGVGLGLSSAGLQTSAVESVGLAETGAASGLFSTSRYLGSIVGSSVMAGLLGAAPGGRQGFAAVFLMVVLGAAASAIISLGLAGRSSSTGD